MISTTPPLAALRLAAGLATDEVSAPGLSVMTFVRLEDGRPGTDPSVRVITAIAEVLGVDVPRVEAAVRRSRSDHAALASFGVHDGRRGEPGGGSGVVAWAQTLVGALRDEVDLHNDAAGRLDRSKLADAAAAVQQVAGQFPVLADRLIATVDRWSRTASCTPTPETCRPWRTCPRTGLGR